LGPEDLKKLCASRKQLDMQLLAVPWVSRSGLMSYLDLQTRDLGQLYEEMEKRLSNVLDKWLDQADPNLPTILTAHASVEGAVYGGERTVLLGKDFVLPKSMVADPRLDYVALGHIHKAQNLNGGNHPPVIYSGSIERVDFGEVKDDKFFVVADVEKGKTEMDWRKLEGIRPFHDRYLKLSSQKDITDQVISALPALDIMKDAVVRLVLEYPRAWAPLIDDRAIQEYASSAFELHFVKRPQMDERIRLPQDQTAGDLTPAELLEKFWQASHVPEENVEALQSLATSILAEEEEEVGETEQEETVAEEEVEVEEVVPAQ
jgi:exonuclease SbcD